MDVEEFKRKVEKAMRYSELGCIDCNGSVDIYYITESTKGKVVNNWRVHGDDDISIQSDWAVCTYNYSQYKKIHIPDIIDVKPIKHHVMRAYFICFTIAVALGTALMYVMIYPYTVPLSWILTWTGIIIFFYSFMLLAWWYPRHRFKKEYGEEGKSNI